MQARRDDDLKDSFYLYIMRNSIGAGLRSQYAPNGHVPDRLTELLNELNSAEEDHGDEDKAGGENRAGGEKKRQNARPARKPVPEK
jgi:hypothetical protein